jgi:RluA family pseudouridine synthase
VSESVHLPPVLFEDDHLIVFDKPAGLLIAPDRWDKSKPNLMTLVHQRLSPNWFNAHRLDKDTSGVLVCAKTRASLDALCAQFERNEIGKEYLALVYGVPAPRSGRIRKSLAPDPKRPGKMVVRRGGKPAETEYEVLESLRASARVRLVPRTGRTHQLRVHLAAIGCPILGDPFYGRSAQAGPPANRLALHAERLTLRHPATGDVLILVAPWPIELERVADLLRRDA